MTKKSLLLGAAIALAPAMANASLIVAIERIDDVTGILTATGTFDSSVSVFQLDGNVTSIGDPGHDPFTGDLMAGGSGVTAVYTRVGYYDFLVAFDDFVALGSGITGSLTITLDAEIWSSIGTSGTLSAQLGTWSITGSGPTVSAVPLPAGMPLLIAGLGALGFARKRKSK